nr:MAG: putative replicase protein [Leviviridae sp.]
MDMKRLGEYVLGLYAAMFDDVAVEFPALRAEFERDCKRLSSAVDKHGIQFALITMPDYRKHFDKCLDSGRLTKSGLIHFGSYRSRGPVPRLFKGLILRVFDDNGELRSCPDVRAIFWIRQLLGAVRKLKLDCSDSSIWEQTDEFFKTDAAVRSPDTNWDDPTDDSRPLRDLDLRDLDSRPSSDVAGLFPDDDGSLAFEGAGDVLATVQSVADIVVSQIGRFDPTEWRARHGPGAVADHNGSYKYDFKHWPAKLQTVFAYDTYGVSSLSALVGDGGSAADHPPYWEHEPAARLIAVPKSLKGPRLIAAEPTAHQWCQQIVRDCLMQRVDQTLLGAFVAFRRQDLSQEMVRRASIDGSLATADLSAASDRLSCYVVERVFRSSPSLVAAFKAVRTRWMRQSLDKHLPPALRLRKFSTMGSALTFPVQSIVFAAVAIGCALHKQGLRPTIRNIRKLRGSVRVFGDDIIVPADCLDLLGNTLTALGLKVNVDKTFGTGRFRESCGEDAYLGHSVATVNINEFPRKSAPGAVMSAVDVHNNLYDRGLCATAAFIKKTVERLGYKFPTVRPATGALGWSDATGPSTAGLKTRWNRLLQRHEVRIHTAKAVVDRVSPEGYASVLQYFTEAVHVPTSAYSTLGHVTGRPKNKLVLGWAASPM